MPILASRLDDIIRSSLDATEASSGASRYDFELDIAPSINFAARKLIQWATGKQGSGKFNSEALRELRKVWVFQTSNYSRVEIPSSVNTINAVYPEITTSPASPSLIGNDTIYTWDIDYVSNGLSAAVTMTVQYDGLTHDIDVSGKNNAAGIASALEDYFHSIEVDDSIDALYALQGPVIATSESGTVYGQLIFKDVYDNLLLSIAPTFSYTTLHNWASFRRSDIVFLGATKDAARTTDEEIAQVSQNPFKSGFNALTKTIKRYSVTEITDFNSLAYSPNPARSFKEIQFQPDRKQKFVGIALVENYSDIDEDTDEVTIPEQMFNIIHEVALVFLRFKQSQDVMTVELNKILTNSVQTFGLSE